MSKKVIIIGSGVGGLATAGLLAKKGYQVKLYEKNAKLGGRMNEFEAEGFRFDMGPSWYLMPDVFEHYFELLGEKVEDHLNLIKLQPSYRIFFKDRDKVIDMYADLDKDLEVFEELEPGSTENVKEYLRISKMQYEIALKRFIYKNYDSIFDFFTWETMTEGSKLSIFSKMDNYVKKFFKTEYLEKIMQYPLVFLGSSPYNTPAIYNIMSHIDFNMGVFYPQGGMYEIAKALVNIAEKNGAELFAEKPAKRIIVEGGKAVGVEFEDGTEERADIVISNADIHHTDTKLLTKEHQQYSDKYWESRVNAPSGLIMYLGLKDEVPSLTHHNLVFSADWKKNFAEIFDDPMFPDDPSFYVCAPSKTDPTVAPKGKENLFVLVPIASGLEYTDEELDAYADKMLDIMESSMDIPNLKDRIEYKRLYSIKDFMTDYNAFQGSALGLAHTLKQTAIFRPNNISKKVKDLYFVGAGTNPGIGVPICLVSAEMVYKRLEGIKASGPVEKL